VCPPEDEHWPYSVPRLISFAEALIGSRTARFQREREERELIEIAREEAPPYTAAPCINFSAIDPTAIYTRLQADLMQPEYCTTSVTPHWNIRIYSDPTNLNACVLKYTHLAGGVELVMVRNQTNVQLTVKINPKIQSKMGYVLIYLLRGEIASDLNRSSTADIWTCDFVSLTSKGMSKELLIHSLTILNKYFKKVPNNSLPIEDLSQRIPDTHTHLPFVSMALAPQMEQEFNNNNNRNNFRA
jgi:hypothetical protein